MKLGECRELYKCEKRKHQKRKEDMRGSMYIIEIKVFIFIIFKIEIEAWWRTQREWLLEIETGSLDRPKAEHLAILLVTMIPNYGGVKLVP